MLRENIITIDVNMVAHGRYVVFQMAEVAMSKELFGQILRLIEGLKPPPVLA